MDSLIKTTVEKKSGRSLKSKRWIDSDNRKLCLLLQHGRHTFPKLNLKLSLKSGLKLFENLKNIPIFS